MDISYSVAEWVVYNKEYIDTFIKPDMSREQVLDVAMQCAASSCPQWSIEDVMSSFDDERVLIVVDFYFIKKGSLQ